MTSFEVSPLSGSPANPDNSTANTSPSSAPTASGLSLAASAAVPPAKPKGKPRKRVNTAEKRNQHNAIERQRRETLNGKFISLARLLPSLAAHRRPSKSAIVNGSIAHLTHQREQRLMAARLLRQLCAERDALAKECAEWRYASGLPARDDLAGTSAWSDEMEEICNVEKEQFGTFAGMEDGAGDDNDNEAENEEDGDDVPASSYGGSFSYPSLIHPPVQQQQAGEMSLEQAAAVAAQASFRASASSSAGSGSALGSNMNGLFAPNAAASLFGGNANPWGQMSLQDLQAFAVANASTGNNGMTTPGANGNGNGNGSGSGMADMFAPASMSSSTASLPFNAFMSDDSVSPGSASNSGYSHVPTPPQTSSLGAGIGMGSASAPAHAFMASLPTVQHTPSPGSSHSFDDAANLGLGLHQAQHKSVHPQPQSQALPQGQWTEQQLMLLRALQQQQQQQQQAQAQQQGFNPLPLSFANNAAAAFALGLNGNGNGSGNVNPGSSPATADSPFSMFASMLPPQQQQKSATNPLYSLGGSGNGNGMGNLPPPPPLTRAQTENLEAWRKLSAMPNPAYRTPVGMGMSFDQLQQAQSRAVEGF